MTSKIHIRGRLAYTVVRESAVAWRRMLKTTGFIAIGGSLGKTTALRCLTTILEGRYDIHSNRDGGTKPGDVAKAILQTRAKHRFSIMETGSRGPGTMAVHSAILKPDVAVMLGIKRTGMDAFGNLESASIEQWNLTKHLRKGALLVLNGDDMRVMTMVDPWRHRVVTFGQSEKCDFRVTEVESRWPKRLSFRIDHDLQYTWVNTQLVGAHWVGAVAAAIATAVCCGVPLVDAAKAVDSVEPFPGRMQPVRLPSGAVMLRDEYSGSVGSLEAALTVLRQARARRRFLVLADADDSGLPIEARMKYLGQRGSESSDLAVFVGEHATIAAQAAMDAGMPAPLVRAFPFQELAAEYLKHELQAGDLVLLKGAAGSQLTRIYFGQLGSVNCTAKECEKLMTCDLCERLEVEPETLIKQAADKNAIPATIWPT